MTPGALLIMLIAITIAAAIAFRIAEGRRYCRLRTLANSFQMHFAHCDRLGLSDRVARVFPLPGAADVRVMDICFRTEAGQHHYLFTVEYSVGVLQSKRRDARAAATSEPVHSPATQPMELFLANASLPLAEQYTQLHERLTTPTK